MGIKQILKDWGLEALILFLFVYIILPFGPGITFDTVSFFQAGDNLLALGKYTHYAADGSLEFAAHRFPLYPLLLGIFRLLDWSLLSLQIILFSAFLAVSRRLLMELSAPKYFLLLFLTVPFVLNFYCLWTESLYAILFVLLAVYLNKEQKSQSVFWIIFVLVALCMSRMVGVVAAVSILCAYAIDKRMLRGVFIAFSGIAIIVAWTFLGQFYLGETARTLAYHPVNYLDLKYIVIELGYWIAVTDIQWIQLILGGSILLFPLVLFLRSWSDRESHGVLHWFLLFHFYGYIVFIVLSKSFLDASIPFDERTMFPLMINFLCILALAQSGQLMTTAQRKKMKFILPKLFLISVVLNAFPLQLIRESGIGYNDANWKQFAFLAQMQEVKSDVTFTNDQAAVYLYGDQLDTPALLPQKRDLYSDEKNPAYSAEMDVMMHQLSESKEGKIIWIRNGITEEVFPSYETLKNHPQLTVLYDDWLCLILEPKLEQ